MWRLCVLCALLSPVSGKESPVTPTSANTSGSDAPDRGGECHQKIPAGPGTGAGNQTDIYACPGSDVLLPVTYKLTRDEDPKKCDEFDWIWRPDGFTDNIRITKSKRCEKPKLEVQRFPNYIVSVDGHLTISNVIRNDSGNYIFTVRDSYGTLKLNHSYTLRVQVPVSQPLLNVSCLQDGGANISCRIDSGDEPQFSISVIGHSLLEILSRTVENVSEVHVPPVSPRPWDITCSVSNRVSNREIKNSDVECPVPVSDPILVVSCLHNGSLEMSCSVENGSDPIFSLSVNGNSLLANYTKKEKRVNVTTLSSGPWDVICSVGNILLWKKTNKTYMACPVAPSDPILEFSCHNGSLEIICSVEKGSDLIFSLSVNGTPLLNNVTSEKRRVNFTASLSGTRDVHCFVGNSLGKRNTTSTYPTCPGSSKATCMSCLQKSVIGGVVALIVTTSPLLIAGFYIGRNTRKDQ